MSHVKKLLYALVMCLSIKDPIMRGSSNPFTIQVRLRNKQTKEEFDDYLTRQIDSTGLELYQDIKNLDLAVFKVKSLTLIYYDSYENVTVDIRPSKIKKEQTRALSVQQNEQLYDQMLTLAQWFTTKLDWPPQPPLIYKLMVCVKFEINFEIYTTLNIYAFHLEPKQEDAKEPEWWSISSETVLDEITRKAFNDNKAETVSENRYILPYRNLMKLLSTNFLNYCDLLSLESNAVYSDIATKMPINIDPKDTRKCLNNFDKTDVFVFLSDSKFCYSYDTLNKLQQYKYVGFKTDYSPMLQDYSYIYFVNLPYSKVHLDVGFPILYTDLLKMINNKHIKVWSFDKIMLEKKFIYQMFSYIPLPDFSFNFEGF